MDYFWKILQHKYFVFQAGLQFRVSIWRLIIHDWTKFLPIEYLGYQRQFFGKVKNKDQWQRTWLHHQNHNPHHWEYWIQRPSGKSLAMPEWAIREMVADWFGASKAYAGFYPTSLSKWDWFQKNKERIQLHEDTWHRVNELLESQLEA